ncbi:extracellular catalytic domain type 1 short-chain-length polyhydroxyalkanoate depolymerase [Caballeronia insecticola]|uniref:Esterase poly(3-hydroxybutyrate) depolymerase n=1 Tax=Caballeronia insecticola TaxID=758793 RepID=A0A060PKC2_9BURK|nr:PHB depolymerase family esterase [Caballeronia insecticola]BAO94016.1 esterase poly(3-hydroxybutyrate) depolymerase [Caballeronia insecticola]
MPESAIAAAPERHCPTASPRSATNSSLLGRLIPEGSKPHWLSNRFEHGDNTLHFKLFVPSSYDGEPMPMVVMLHGAQQDPDDFAAGTEMNAAAEAQGYIVVYPEQSEYANPLRCWNWFRPADRQRESGETAMIAALTREVMTIINVDETRVYVAGMSAGGAMAINLAVMYPDLYAAAGSHSGMAFGVADESLSALCAMNDGLGKCRLPARSGDDVQPRAVPLIVFHGDLDDTVHPRNSDQIVAMSRQLSGGHDDGKPLALTHVERDASGLSHTRHVFYDADGAPDGEQWIVHGLGHAWSGGSPAGTHTDARGPHASKEIIRFFGQHSLAR